MHALLRDAVPHHLPSVQADELTAAALYIASMLGELPFKTIGDVAVHGLELYVFCPSCHSTRRLVDLERWADRCFATARFRCTGTRYDSIPCRGIGMPVIRPAELLPVGGPVTLAFLTCPRCIWEINQAQLDKPPWSGSRQHYRCPGCVAVWPIKWASVAAQGFVHGCHLVQSKWSCPQPTASQTQAV